MRHSHDVSQVVGVVAEDIRVKPGRGGGAEGAAPFALTDLRIDPALVEELGRDLLKARGEGPEGLQDHLAGLGEGDRKSTRLNSSHSSISYAVFCLKKKTINQIRRFLCSLRGADHSYCSWRRHY